ncbi:MAG TPA: hypothetical protein VJJ27_00740 [Candidatus Paceibacterota bacterium]
MVETSRNFSLKDDRGLIPFFLVLLILYLILRYSYDFDVVKSVQNEGLGATLGRFFAIFGGWWTNGVKPFILEALKQIAQVVIPPK